MSIHRALKHTKLCVKYIVLCIVNGKFGDSILDVTVN